jgi:hypothetical protein
MRNTLTVLITALAVFSGSASAANAKPNILFLFADDPLEMRDLAADTAHAGRIRSFSTELLCWQQTTGDVLDLKAAYPALAEER